VSVTSELRAMTAEERETAETLLAETRVPRAELAVSGCVLTLVGALVGFFVGAILLAAILIIGSFPPGDWTWKGLATFAVVGLAFALSKVLAPLFRRNDRAERLAEDVHGGIVEVLDVEAFIAWREIDREPAFTFDVAGEQPFHTKGAVLAPLVEQGTFPCRRFTLVRLPSSRVPLACEPRGEPLPPRA
jgi:hypothetical protein